MMNKPIVVKCLPREDFNGGMKFWCPFCKTWHLHGRGNGERVSHCVLNDSPLNRSITIKMLTDAELKTIRKAITEYLQWKTDEAHQNRSGDKVS